MKNTPKIHPSEYRCCLIVWEKEPLTSMELARLCKENLNWSRTTTYTVLKRLQDRGVLVNERTMVTSLIPKADVQLDELDELYNKRFENSLPAFVHAVATLRGLDSVGAGIKETLKYIDLTS